MMKVLKLICKMLVIIGIFVCMDLYSAIDTGYSGLVINFAHPFIYFCAVVMGPLVGGITAGVGETIVMLLQQKNDVPAVIVLTAAAVLMGFLMRKVNIEDGFFGRKDTGHFIMWEYIINYFCFGGLYPLLHYFWLKHDFSFYFQQGTSYALSYGFGTMILTTLFIALYSRSRISAANFYRN